MLIVDATDNHDGEVRAVLVFVFCYLKPVSTARRQLGDRLGWG
ncbi:hypothetical protein Psta_0426 [Pirellula staleyi DSM 6068]|uniref:Uncharacterized protein n=1 Tax=Pirellula staleyi (strain ATCC 27377 / DSM 6068 / ICPB 4128) TaxID=530564 RepID=D2R385_PIRSD|nr:hypothetical protein Psta_0426 [Pirellula staleyi DSM 6068]